MSNTPPPPTLNNYLNELRKVQDDIDLWKFSIKSNKNHLDEVTDYINKYKKNENKKFFKFESNTKIFETEILAKRKLSEHLIDMIELEKGLLKNAQNKRLILLKSFSNNFKNNYNKYNRKNWLYE